ncbi:MAG: hypothetical protein O3B41_11810 [Bacteroidetes bacterium]|nr:hypothetical protein [Bacteroidota bacterium]
MKLSYKILLLFGAMFWTIIPGAFSQAFKNNPISDAEVFLMIEHPTASIIVTSTPSALDSTLPATVDASTDGPGDSAWGGDFNCGTTNETDFDCNKVYTIKFDVEESTNDIEFQFFLCETNHVSYSASSHGFYCIDPISPNNNDIELTYTTNGAWELSL